MNWFEVAFCAAAGAIGGALGGLLSKLLEATATKRVAVGAAIAAGVVAGQMLAGPAQARWEDAQDRTPYQRFERTSERLVREDDAFKAHVKAMMDRGLSRKQAFDESRAVGARGLRRLSDADLLQRAAYVARGLEAMDARQCAELARGRGDAATLEVMVNALGRGDAESFAALLMRGTHAELVEDPPARPASTQADAQRIFALFAERAPASDVQLVQGMFEPTATDDVVCGGLRALYRALPSLPADEQPRLTLVLTGL